MHKCGVDVNDGFVHDFVGNGSNGRSQTACQVGQFRSQACFGDEHDELLVLESRDRKGVGRVAWQVGHCSVEFGFDDVICGRFSPVLVSRSATDVADAKGSDNVVFKALSNEVDVGIDFSYTENSEGFEGRPGVVSDGVAKVSIGGVHICLEESVLVWVFDRGEGS